MFTLYELTTQNNSLSNNVADKLNTPEKCYYFIRDNIQYKNDIFWNSWETPDTILERKWGVCSGMAILYSSMLSHLGYENKLVITQVKKTKGLHVFNGIKIQGSNGKWVYCDTTAKKTLYGQLPNRNQLVIGEIYSTGAFVKIPTLFNKCCSNFTEE